MKTKLKLVVASLFFASAGAVAFYPAVHGIGAVNPPPPPGQRPVTDPQAEHRPRVEVVFVLDTTSSMSGLIHAAKEKIWSIATTMASAQPAPDIRFGLVAFRDRGDAYITQVSDLSADLDSTYAKLMDFQARGGGDGPESVNQALYDAVHRISWSQDDKAYKVIFLVGDAPPHMDYRDDVKFPKTLAVAGKRGIVVNAIQAGRNRATTQRWQQIAQLGNGNYFQVGAAGNAVAIATPFDRRLAELSKELDETRLYYGSPAQRAATERKVDATKKLHAGASLASRARRATFNASTSGKANLLGKNELVDDLAAGRVDLDAIEKEALPEPMQTMAPAEQRAKIAETAAKRDQLQRQIAELAAQRTDFLRREVDASGGAKDSLDSKLYRAIRSQGNKKGLRYESNAPAY